jgi:hypothetical protein
VGAVTGLYATLYSFLKYFKAWYAHNGHNDEKTLWQKKRKHPYGLGVFFPQPCHSFVTYFTSVLSLMLSFTTVKKRLA